MANKKDKNKNKNTCWLPKFLKKIPPQHFNVTEMDNTTNISSLLSNNMQLCRICITSSSCSSSSSSSPNSNGSSNSTQMISIFGEDSLWKKITTLADVKVKYLQFYFTYKFNFNTINCYCFFYYLNIYEYLLHFNWFYLFMPRLIFLHYILFLCIKC